MKNIFETIKEIAEAKVDAKKAINQIDAYETEQRIKKLTDKLVAQYAELEEPIDERKIERLALRRYTEFVNSGAGTGIPNDHFPPWAEDMCVEFYKYGYRQAKEEL